METEREIDALIDEPIDRSQCIVTMPRAESSSISMRCKHDGDPSAATLFPRGSPCLWLRSHQLLCVEQQQSGGILI
ncbi:hypothetical protein EYF80_044715 [Liparis tanakae]|uniref:Uncharacterized protein n=1 Tax=Liparis tanakae TaxID=230148 RepID=A0A4Z2FVY5_9TELE|nr:hypothetical protein EYF80_044715 [Liparis tanakae]